MTQWKHNDLQYDLAEHLRSSGDRVIWENMQLGPSGSARPDVYSMPKSYSKFYPLAYEIKISTSDFRRDVTSGKWQSYLKFAAGVIFAVPAGLVTKDDVPKGCGLIVRHENVWRMAKGPTLLHIESLPHEVWMKLMIDGINRAARGNEPRTLHKYEVERQVRQKYGEEIGLALSDMNRAVEHLRYMQHRAEATASEIERIRSDAIKNAERESVLIDGARHDLCRALGIPEDSSCYTISSRCFELARRLNENEEITRLRKLFDRIQESVASACQQFEIPQVEQPKQDVELMWSRGQL
jgi:hypothetical protein